MHAMKKTKRTSPGYVSVAQIRRRYKAEWILLEDPRVNRAGDVIGGKLVCHSKDRDEVDREAIRRKARRSAFLYTGKIPSGTAIIL